MKDHIKSYKDKLGKAICDYMDMPVSERSASAVHAMLECLEEVEERMGKSCTLTHEDAKTWAAGLVNDDGTTGAHWTMEQTTGVAKAAGVEFDHISDWCWWIAMNMIYSDYSSVAERFGVGTPDFFAELTKAFLFDKDGPGPEKKLSAYYYGIVCTDY